METEKAVRAHYAPNQGHPQNLEQYRSAMTSRTKCSCLGDGWILRDGKVFRCPCSIDRRLAVRLPEKYRGARLADFNASIRQFIESWLVRPTSGLFIFGAVGTGKTHLAAAMFQALLQVQADVTFERAAQFFAALQESYRANTSTETIVEELERPRFLILDDIGSGALSDHERRFTLEVIERRVNRNRPAILTSNWNRQEIGEKMDARISSRLALFTELELSGVDLREVHGDKPVNIKNELRPAREELVEEPITETQRRELEEIGTSLKQRLGLLVPDKNGKMQTFDERIAELRRQAQIIRAKYRGNEQIASD